MVTPVIKQFENFPTTTSAHLNQLFSTPSLDTEHVHLLSNLQ